MKCYMCGYIVNHPDDLIAIADKPKSINDFVHCPICRSNHWEESSDDNTGHSDSCENILSTSNSKRTNRNGRS